mmetsp:Transcript_59663/g.172817  ORF Transcript_59663/g.172817 Transcript_59663/m.172817 type:complete len:207 (+) Transcript_59663:880-1500(+)
MGVLVGEQSGQSLFLALHELCDCLFRALPCAASRLARLDREDDVQHALGLLAHESDVRVLMHAENLRRLIEREARDELPEAFDRRHIAVRRTLVLAAGGERVLRVQDLGCDVLFQYREQANAVLVVGDAPAIVDVPDDEEEGVPWDASIQLQHVVCDGGRSLQVRVVELVPDVPAKGAEFAALLDNGVEKLKAELDPSPLRLLRGV